MKILMILTSHEDLGDTGEKTGFWLEEFAAPYYVFKDAGADITLASPEGGQPPLDPKSDEPDARTDATMRFKDDEEAQAHLASTLKLAEVDASHLDGVFYPGGHGPLWDLAESADSKATIEGALSAGKTVALVCHAPAVLKNVTSPTGDPIVKGRKVNGFSNEEEDAVGACMVHRVEGRAGVVGANRPNRPRPERSRLIVIGETMGAPTASSSSRERHTPGPQLLDEAACVPPNGAALMR